MPIHYLTLRTNNANHYEIEKGLLTFNLPSSFYNKIKGDCYVSCILSSFERRPVNPALYFYFDFNPFNHHISNNEDNFVPLSKVNNLFSVQLLGSNNLMQVKIPRLKNTIQLKIVDENNQAPFFSDPPIYFNLVNFPCICVLKFETKDETKQLENYSNTLYKTLV